MRVIAGTARSIRLKVPEGNDIRPTIDRYKETVFNILNQRVVGARFLDIFAGSGANGIEALSRGALYACFVENSRQAQSVITTNLEFTKLFEKGTLMKYDYIKALGALEDQQQKFDIIYLDPPFNQGLENDAIDRLLRSSLIEEGGIIVCESDSATEIQLKDESYEIYKEKEFKSCKFTFIRAK